MKAPTQILPPSNWQDFEELCKRIWEIKWNFPDDIIRNGRAGQSQNGVDISAYVENKHGYCGVQCKGKENFTNKQMTKSEIDAEIDKAKNFKPALKSFTFATTAPKDAEIEEYIRTRNIENIEAGLFSVAIFSWEDIVTLIEQYKSIKEWYVYEKLQSFEPDIEILLNKQVATKEHPIILNPEYTKQDIFFEYKPRLSFDMNPYSGVAAAIPSNFYLKGNSVKIQFDINNNGDFLENCLFSVALKESPTHKFHGESIYEKINSPYIIEDYYMQTSKEFTLHGGFTKSIEVYIDFSDKPFEEEVSLECCFTSKQNKKPFCKNLFIKSIPIVTELPPKKTITHYPDEIKHTVVIKPKEID